MTEFLIWPDGSKYSLCDEAGKHGIQGDAGGLSHQVVEAVGRSYSMDTCSL